MTDIAILGAGAFGTALAIALAAEGPVTLWARDPGTARALATTRPGPAPARRHPARAGQPPPPISTPPPAPRSCS